MTTVAEIGVMQPPMEDQAELSEARKGKEEPSLRASGGRMARLTLWLQTFGLQNCEKISFCCFKASGL